MEFNNEFWRECIGSGHAALTLRDDWREQMKSTHDTLQFKEVRFHGIFDDDVGSVNGINDYSFININKIYKYLLSINMRPYVEISYVPYLFASNNCQGHISTNHYHPCLDKPSDYNVWYDFIQQWIKNLINEFGINEVKTWKFEVYNEPNNVGWTFSEYLEFYNHTATAIKSVSNELLVGGPSTGAEAWITQFCNSTQALNIPLDFVSTHAYPNHVTNGIVPNYINSYFDALHKLSQQVQPYKLPIYVSEWNSACCANAQSDFYNNDNYYAAAFLIYMVNHLQPLFVGENSLLKSMSYWAVSDIFEENGFYSNEFSDYYGLTTIRGINKPIFRAFELLQKYAANAKYRYVAANLDGINAENNTIEMYGFGNEDNESNEYALFIANWNLLNLNISEKELHIFIETDESLQLQQATMYRIDNETTNPLQAWRNMNSPKYPTLEQLQKLNESSQLVAINNVNYTKINETTLLFTIHMPEYSVVVLDLKYQN